MSTFKCGKTSILSKIIKRNTIVIIVPRGLDFKTLLYKLYVGIL